MPKQTELSVIKIRMNSSQPIIKLQAVSITPVKTQPSRKGLRFAQRLNQDNQEVNTIVGANFKFDCTVIGKPEPNITWTKDEKPLKDVSYRTFGPGGMEKVFIIELKNVLVADSGKYKCTADNKVLKPITTSLKLNVKEHSHDHPPVIREFYSTRTELQEGETVALFCSVEDVEDFTPFIKWVRYRTYNETKEKIIKPLGANLTTLQPVTSTASPVEERILSVRRMEISKYVINGIVHESADLKLDRSYQSSLFIHNVTVSDTGEYSCIAFNEIGFHKMTSYVRVVPVPPLSKEQLEKNYVRKYGTFIDLPISMSAIVVIPVCLLIMLVIGCVWWSTNHKKLDEENIEVEKQGNCTEENNYTEMVVPILSMQSKTSGGALARHNSIDFSVSSLTQSHPSVHYPMASKEYSLTSSVKDASEKPLRKKSTKSSGNLDENCDEAQLLVGEKNGDEGESFPFEDIGEQSNLSNGKISHPQA